MKTFFGMLALLLLVPAVSKSQIPNGDFETWSNGSPVNWNVDNIPSFATPITQSTTAHGGSSALRGEVVSTLGGPIGPLVQSGTNGAGFPISQRYASCSGYYQFSPVGGDRFGVTVLMYHNGNPVGGGAVALSGTASSYTQFTADIEYSTADVPDTCVIQMLIIGPDTGGDYHVGSSMLVDDLSLGGTVTSVGEQRVPNLPTNFSLAQNYPNPFNPSTTIEFELPRAGNVTLSVYDVFGNEVKRLVDRQMAVGAHTITFDATGLASGVYFYRLTAGEFTDMRKLVLVR